MYLNFGDGGSILTILDRQTLEFRPSQKVSFMKKIKRKYCLNPFCKAMAVVRMIKLFGWEPRTSQRLQESREKELEYIYKDRVGILSLRSNMYLPNGTAWSTCA